MVDQEARKRIEALEAQGMQRDREIADLSGRLSRLAATLEAIRIEVSGARVPAAGSRPPKSAVSSAAASRGPARPIDSPARPPNPPIANPAVPSVPAPQKPPPPQAPARAPPVARPPPPAPNARAPSSIPAPPPAPAGFASLIVADFPVLFAEFRGKRFTLLWRGSRDHFGANDFHRRCDGHANTLTMIEDTKGNIFGGFTPVEWDSSGNSKPDPSLTSFLFTLKNPHNVPARRFALKPEKKYQTIDSDCFCWSLWGPHFRDIVVSDHCCGNKLSFTYLGYSYVNDTGDRGQRFIPGEAFFTGSEHFQVKEIEVFEITD